MQQWHMIIVLIYSLLAVDALEVLSQRRRESDEDGCTLPAYPEHGQWKLLASEAKPGDKAPNDSVIKYECNSGYALTSSIPFLVCDGRWSSSRFPECEKLCPPLYSSKTFAVKCKDRTGNEIKCNEATDGTYAEYKCSTSYETPFGYKKALLCINGNWNQKPVCQPVCGKKIAYEESLVGPDPNKKLEYPWVAAIYKKGNNSYKYLCGGTVLSSRIVVTAAHCVANDYGDVLPDEDFRVGVGKLYNQYNAPNDTHAQYLELSKIIVHEDYKGDSRRFLADIAVLVVKDEIVLSKEVQPICFNNLNTINLHPGIVGKVSGWRQTKEEDTLETEQTLEVPIKDDVTCTEELPKSWADKYFLIDKICAGHFNKSISVCDKGSGGGLVFLNKEDDRYYIHGIVSLGPQKEGHCDIQQNTLYTKLAFYYEYMDRLLTTYEPVI